MEFILKTRAVEPIGLMASLCDQEVLDCVSRDTTKVIAPPKPSWTQHPIFSSEISYFLRQSGLGAKKTIYYN